MELANCAKCGKVFARIGKNICPECRATADLIFQKVRDYVEENPGLTIQKVAENCGVPPERIYDFLKEGRLQGHNFASGAARWQCEACGSYITAGRLCNRCQTALSEGGVRQSRSLNPTQFATKTDKGKIHLSRWRDR